MAARKIHTGLPRQIRKFKEDAAQFEGLPFADVISERRIEEIMERETAEDCRDRVFPPAKTLAAMTARAPDEDHTCAKAVKRFAADLAEEGVPACSQNTGGYCKARIRLPENLFFEVLRDTGRALHQAVPAKWRWRGRPVKMTDGTTIAMPDTPENQAVYPLEPNQKEGLGFPIARIGCIISLDSGSVLDAAAGPYSGKGTGDAALFRRMSGALEPGDILLADKYYCSYWEIALLREKNVDIIMPQHARRKTDFSKGKRLGASDHVVTWEKPEKKPDWMDEETYQRLPDTLEMREFKSRGKVLVTALLNPKEYSSKDISELYSGRWTIEVDLRFIKTVMGMDIMSGKTPEMVRKEIASYLLAYNLIRLLTVQAAHHGGIPLSHISFTSARQALDSYREKFRHAANWMLMPLYKAFIAAILSQKVGKRPGRIEPRAVKRRKPKKYPYMNKPRQQMREELIANAVPA